jgi:hypothetical protein
MTQEIAAYLVVVVAAAWLARRWLPRRWRARLAPKKSCAGDGCGHCHD